LLGEGDTVAADCRLTEAYGARVNSVRLNGESLFQTSDALESH
jgi:hypothetical protein